MPTIGLITTGECEHAALGPSLERIFPGVDAVFERPFLKPLPSITSGRLTYPAPTEGPTRVDKLVDSVMATLESKERPDFVFVIDDLELVNVETPDHVTRRVSDGFRQYLRRRGGAPTHKEIERLASRCSFHLLCPMVEAYFYGEPAAIERAGAKRPAILAAERLEAFRSEDPDFLEPADGPRHHPWRHRDRALHPKKYLSFLVDPDDLGEDEYKETRDGRRALERLDWEAVLRREPRGAPFAHALFADLADALGAPDPFPWGEPHPLTARRSGGRLRNLE